MGETRVGERGRGREGEDSRKKKNYSMMMMEEQKL